MKRLILLAAALMAVAGTQYVSTLAPAAQITIEAYSPTELAALGWTTKASTGLSVVGLQTTVYLYGSEAAGEAVTAYTWTITAPDGSTVTPDVQGAERTTFRPQLKGDYTIALDITTASGTASATTTLTAGTYVGVGTVGGQNPDFRIGQCAACHFDNTMDWEATKHAVMFEHAIDGIKSDHYGNNCISCHTLGYDVTAVNGGFDDVATELGWTFPTVLQPGEWQKIVDNYPTLAAKANIQCESCHGPGSEHKGNVSKIDLSVEVGVCAQCHESGSHHVRPTQWKTSKHATGTSFARGTSTGCAPCHSTYGFIARIDPLSDLDQKVGTGEPVTCVACHDPHSVENPNQLRTVADVELIDGTVVNWGGNGRLCMNCHKARRTGATQVETGGTRQDPHHSNQVDMLAANRVANTFGRYIPSSTHRNALEDACVSCHMYETPAEGPGLNKVGDHTFGVAADVDGVMVENVEVCVRCHGELESFEDLMARVDYDGDGAVESAMAEVEGLMDEVAMRLPPVGEPTFTVANSWSRQQKMAAFNYNFVLDDGSGGMHNFQYSIGLLKLTVELLDFGILAPGAIQSVVDVPNDQGRQVQVMWNRFGGDGTSDDPVVSYYVWRKDNIEVAAKGNVTTLDKVAGKAIGTTIDLAGEVWTAVAGQPAAQLDMYSAIVPTLGDGADAEFMVTGHTRSGVVSMSGAMAGQSADNLAPAAPTGMVATATGGKVNLIWDDPIDGDFKYFAVYRGTTSGFAVGEPVATTTDPAFVDNTVAEGNTYYYRVSAYDFNGNQGALSAEAMAAVGTGAESLGVPTEFALHQNYPNPFNPTTTISFDVPVTSDVTISVYDILGRQVKLLVDESKAAGRHEVQMDGSSLTSGLYIVRMRTGSRVFERSVVLMK